MKNRTIAKRLRKLRGTMRRKDVAEFIGISVSALAMYETGHRIPKDTVKSRLSKFYNVSVDSLFF